MVTDRDGHWTAPMVAFSGMAGDAELLIVRDGVGVGVGVGVTGRCVVGVAVGVGLWVVGVGLWVVGVGLWVVGVGVGVGVLVGTTADRVWLGVARALVAVAVADADALGVGVLDARDDDDVDRISAGTAINAPMTKNTAAIMILGSCIASSPPVTEVAGKPRSFFILGRIVPITRRIGLHNSPTGWCEYHCRAGTRMME